MRRGWPSRIRRTAKWVSLAACALLGTLWVTSCLAVLHYHDGDGGVIQLSAGTLTLRGGLSSRGTVEYTLVPMSKSASQKPSRMPVKATVMRRLHQLPSRGLRVGFGFTPGWGRTHWFRRAFCGAYFACNCASPNNTSGFWMQQVHVAMWVPFLLVASPTLFVWRREIRRLFSPVM